MSRWSSALLISAVFAPVGLASAQSAADDSAADVKTEGDDSGFYTKLYGYLDAYWEKVGRSPAGISDTGETTFESNPHEFDVPNINVMMQSTYGGRFKGFLNLKAPGAEFLDVRNAWVDVVLAEQLLHVRAGKLYRPFGLYNELLDAVPTYIGIEPPELFDKDHLMLTRTTNLMLWGEIPFGDSLVAYAVTTGNDERAGNEIPIGADLHYDWGTNLRLGTSLYTTAGDAAPSRGVGDGSPEGGVATWMARDKYVVYGGYLQIDIGGLLLQSEFWHAQHEGERDATQVLKLLDAGLNARQKRRFGLDGPNPTEADVRTDAKYAVETYYLRLGYSLETSFGELIPYAQYDYYMNKEAIAKKSFGGDNEAGLADDGLFHKGTVGAVWRPAPPVALKVDIGAHLQEFNQKMVTYYEGHASLSYVWSLN